MSRQATSAQLQATYATLQAAAAQVLAMIAALEEEDEETEVETRCPKCGSPDVVEAGRGVDGQQVFACACGHNFPAVCSPAGAELAMTVSP